MSVGGKVVQTYLREDHKLWVNTYDGSDYCAIYVNGNHNIKLNDTLWWQGQKAFWSRKNVHSDPLEWEFSDEKIDKLSGSGVSHPLGKEYEIKYDLSVILDQKKEQILKQSKYIEELENIIAGLVRTGRALSDDYNRAENDRWEDHVNKTLNIISTLRNITL